MHAELDQPARQDRLGFLPCVAEGIVLHKDGVLIQDIVEIDHRIDARVPEGEDLREPEVELIEPPAVQRAWLDDVDACEICRRSAERRFDLVVPKKEGLSGFPKDILLMQ